MKDTDNSLFMDAVSMADGSSTRKSAEDACVPQRNYKDTVFRLLFNDRETLLSLFNAVNGTSYRQPQPAAQGFVLCGKTVRKADLGAESLQPSSGETADTPFYRLL